jgi:DNA modification methylase
LRADFDAGLSLDQFFDSHEMAALLAQLAPQTDRDPDALPAMRATEVKTGDVLGLGGHRLVCGDCTRPEIVSALIGSDVPLLAVSDPPYGVELDGSWREGVGGKFGGRPLKMRGAVLNDDRADWLAAWSLFPGDVAYVWCASLRLPDAWRGIVAAGFAVRAVPVWAKPSLTISRGHYHHQYEPFIYAVRRGSTARWCGDRSQATLWQIAGMNPAGGSRETKLGHPTQKPVECMARPMRNHGVPGDFVFDPFVGSGTSVIAAQRERRRCLAVELEPAFVQMCIDRFETFTGERARKLGEVARG